MLQRNKEETSGHFQYVKSISIDCDEDTILIKVKQVGIACHTGSESCFYREVWNIEEGLDKISMKEGNYHGDSCFCFA